METLHAILDLMGRQAGGVILRILGGGILGLILGIVVVPVFYLPLARRGWLDLGKSWDRFVRGAVFVLWALAIPSAVATAGLTLGAGYAASAVIESEHLGEAAGLAVFRCIVPLALAASDRAVGPEHEALVHAYATGECGVPIASIEERVRTTPDLLGGRAGDQVASLLATEAGLTRSIAGHALGKVVKWIVRSKVEDRTEMIVPVVDDLVTRDRAGNADGLATADEIAASLSRVWLEPRLSSFVFKWFLTHAVLFASAAPGLVLLTTGLLRLAARLLRPKAPPPAPAAPTA